MLKHGNYPIKALLILFCASSPKYITLVNSWTRVGGIMDIQKYKSVRVLLDICMLHYSSNVYCMDINLDIYKISP